jgi:hypothetical protein
MLSAHCSSALASHYKKPTKTKKQNKNNNQKKQVNGGPGLVET